MPHRLPISPKCMTKASESGERANFVNFQKIL
jgi:hypothetical protein